jgi:hypothetical protein
MRPVEPPRLLAGSVRAPVLVGLRASRVVCPALVRLAMAVQLPSLVAPQRARLVLAVLQASLVEPEPHRGPAVP